MNPIDRLVHELAKLPGIGERTAQRLAFFILRQPKEYAEALGTALADVKERARRRIMVTQFLRDRFLPRLREPPRRDLVEYYQAHLDEFTTPAKAELLLIEVPVESELGKRIAQATPSSSLSSQWRLTRWSRLPASSPPTARYAPTT